MAAARRRRSKFAGAVGRLYTNALDTLGAESISVNPRERTLCALKGKPADRVPLVLPGFQLASRAGLAQIEDRLKRDVAERIMDVTGFRVLVPSHVNRMLVTPPQRIRTERKDLPNGHWQSHGTIDTPLGELTYVMEWNPVFRTWWMVKYPVEDHGDIERIASVPWELPHELRPPSLDDLPEEFPTRGLLGSFISSPVVCVSGMMRYEWFLELCATRLELIEELTEICTRRVLDCVEVLLSEPGLDYVWMGGSEWVTPPMASPEIYDRLVQEQERRIIECVHENSDAVAHVHCHGHVRHALSRMIEGGADYTEPVEPPPDGDVTMAEAKEIAAGRITLGGNVECRILCRGSEDEVEAVVRAAFEGGKKRFVLRPTEGPSPRLSGREFRNYMRLIDVWEELSPLQ